MWQTCHFEIQLEVLADRDSLFEKLKRAVDKYGGYVSTYDAADDVTFYLTNRYPTSGG